MPASYQNLKKSRNSGRFWNSPPTGLLHQDGLPAIVSLDEHSRVSHLARERNAASRADAGILAMWISDGRKGVSHLLRQATRVKVSAFWHWPLFWKNIFKSPGHELFFLFANVTGLCFLICAVYLGSRSLLLAMMTHWSSNAARAIVGKLLPGLPANAADTSTWRWCVFGVLALIVAGTIPVLLRVDRQAQRNARAAAR